MPRAHVKAFIAASGPGPWPCVLCGQEVLRAALNVHHADGDHSNDAPGNLKAAHRACHAAWHAAARSVGDESDRRSKIAATQQANWDRRKRDAAELELYREGLKILEPLVEELAAQGDTYARYFVRRLRELRDGR